MSQVFPQIELLSTKVSVSKFIFGTASIFKIGSQKKRLDLLSTAAEVGFTHFDTAPYYGFGWSEKDLGILVNRYPHITITSKVGINSPGGEDQAESLVYMRKVLGKVLPILSRPNINFSIKNAEISLEGSLRRLGRDYIDIFFLHEPQVHFLHVDEWTTWLEKKVMEGKIRSYGVALQRENLESFLELKSPLVQVVQTQDSLLDSGVDFKKFNFQPQITYGYLSSALKNSDSIDSSTILNQALQRNKSGAIIVSTTKKERIKQYSEILGSLS